MRISNSTVRHLSTNFFRRTKIFAYFFPEHDSETRSPAPVKCQGCNCNERGAISGRKFFRGPPTEARILTTSNEELRELRTTLCPHPDLSFILNVCPNTVDGIRSSYLSCPSVHSSLTGASEARSMAFARA